MRRILPVLVALLALTSCKGTGWAHVDEFGPAVELVSDRHDAYVQADQGLQDEQREAFLKTTELLRRLIRELRK